MVIHPDDHPLSDVPDPVPLDAVVAHPIVSIGRLDAPEMSDFESYQLFRDGGYDIEPVQATNQPQTLVALVRRGIGVGVTNWLAAQVADTNGVRVRKLKAPARRRVAVCWDSSRPLSPAARGLLRGIVDATPPVGTEAVSHQPSE